MDKAWSVSGSKKVLYDFNMELLLGVDGGAELSPSFGGSLAPSKDLLLAASLKYGLGKTSFEEPMLSLPALPGANVVRLLMTLFYECS
jgi:hypothetical protein